MEIQIQFDYRGRNSTTMYDLDQMSIGAFNVLVNEDFKAFRYIVNMIDEETNWSKTMSDLMKMIVDTIVAKLSSLNELPNILFGDGGCE